MSDRVDCWIAAGEPLILERQSDEDLLSQLGTTAQHFKGSLMPASTQSSDGVITKSSSKSVQQTIDELKRLMADRGFTVFNVIDHSGVAERAGVQMPDSKLVLFGKPNVGAAVMVAAPLCGLRHPTQGVGLGGQERSGISELQLPGVMAERHHLEGA